MLSNLMIKNNTYWEQDLYLKSQNPTCLHFFSNNSELYNISFYKDISSDFEIKSLFFHFSNY